MAAKIKCIVTILLKNNLELKVLMVNSRIKHAVHYEKRHSLPDEVKNAPTIDSFHKRCLKWLVN